MYLFGLESVKLIYKIDFSKRSEWMNLFMFGQMYLKNSFIIMNAVNQNY